MKYSQIKRLLDILISSGLLIVLSPLLLATLLVIKINSQGPIIFKQERIGKNGIPFTIYKFRSMLKNNNLLNFNEKDNVTNIGKLLRRFGIDELPQLLNVLKGEMSLIGPRPFVPLVYEYFTEKQKLRQSVRPGLMPPTLCYLHQKDILDLINIDINYVNNISFFEDVKTIFTVINKLPKIYVLREEDSKGNKNEIYNQIQILKSNLEKSNCSIPTFVDKIFENDYQEPFIPYILSTQNKKLIKTKKYYKTR